MASVWHVAPDSPAAAPSPSRGPQPSGRRVCGPLPSSRERPPASRPVLSARGEVGSANRPCLALPGGCVVFCCVFRFCVSPWPLCRREGGLGRPCLAGQKASGPRSSCGAPGVRCLTRSPALPWLFFSRLAPVTTWTVPGAGGGGRALSTPVPHLPRPCTPAYPTPGGSSPLQAGARASCQPQGSCSPTPSPASAKAQTPAALRFGDGGDASPCGLAPQGAGYRVQPCSPAPSSLRPVREHQGFGGAQRLQTCHWTGDPRGPDALGTFHWAGASLSPSPAEQRQSRSCPWRGGQGPGGSAPRHQTGEAVGRAKPVWAPSVKALIPGARPSPASPAPRAGPRAAGPQQGREALVSVCPLPTGFVPLSPTACPQLAAQVRLNGVREPHSRRHPQPWSEPQLKLEAPGLGVGVN